MLPGPALSLALALALVGLLAGCTGLDAQQRKWIFQPSRIALQTTPEAAPSSAPSGIDDVWIEHVSTESGRPIRLHALWQPGADASAPLLRLVLVDGGSHYSTNAVGARQYRQALRELFGLGAGAPPIAAAE